MNWERLRKVVVGMIKGVSMTGCFLLQCVDSLD